MEKQPDEPGDFTNEPLPSMSEPMEVEAVSSLATPFAQPIITAAKKTKAQRQREYRQRIAASRTPAQAAAARRRKNERQRKNRLRQAAKLAIASGSLGATTTSPKTTQIQLDIAKPKIAAPKKTRAQIQREYRQRKAASRTAAREARNDRNNRLRQAANLAIASPEATTTPSSCSGQNTVHSDIPWQFTDQHQTLATEPMKTIVQPSTSSDHIEFQGQSTGNTKWASSIMRSKSFLDNDFGYASPVDDRVWFRNDLKLITAQLKVISDWFIKENRPLKNINWFATLAKSHRTNDAIATTS